MVGRVAVYGTDTGYIGGKAGINEYSVTGR